MVVEETTLVMPVADVVDLAAERARLEKECGKIEGEMSKLEKKLANQNFIAKRTRSRGRGAKGTPRGRATGPFQARGGDHA